MNAQPRSETIAPIRLIALLAVLALITAACGQHAEVNIADAEVRGSGGASGAGDGVAEDGFGDLDESDDEGLAAGGADGFDDDAAAGGDGSAGGEQSGQGGGQQAQGSGGGGGAPTGSQEPQGSDRTGAGPDELVIGIHAPVTGAAPLPTTSFERSRDLYWKHVIDRDGDVLGRASVEVLFRDDRYDPSAAVQVCREMASRAFTLVGGGGTDQIQACGRYANQAEVPYFSAGVTEAGLQGNPWYFASSMSYKQQGPLLAQYVSKNFGGAKTAMVVTDTENFDDAIQGWMQGVQRQGIDYYDTLRHPRGDNSWYRSFAADLDDAGVEVVYVLTSPVDYIRFAQQAHEIGYEPQFVGVGITKGLNAVLGSGCPEVDGGVFFSPFPGLDWARTNVPDFFTAADDHDGVKDDLSLALWGIAKTQHELFEAYGSRFGHDLTREDFRAVVERSSVESGVFPSLSYRPDDHFGASTTHVLRADCDAGEHETVATFASGF